MGADVLMGSYGYVFDRINKDFNSVEVEREFEMVEKYREMATRGT